MRSSNIEDVNLGSVLWAYGIPSTVIAIGNRTITTKYRDGGIDTISLECLKYRLSVGDTSVENEDKERGTER